MIVLMLSSDLTAKLAPQFIGGIIRCRFGFLLPCFTEPTSVLCVQPEPVGLLGLFYSSSKEGELEVLIHLLIFRASLRKPLGSKPIP